VGERTVEFHLAVEVADLGRGVAHVTHQHIGGGSGVQVNLVAVGPDASRNAKAARHREPVRQQAHRIEFQLAVVIDVIDVLGAAVVEEAAVCADSDMFAEAQADLRRDAVCSAGYADDPLAVFGGQGWCGVCAGGQGEKGCSEESCG
jgi:hypothetical protein